MADSGSESLMKVQSEGHLGLQSSEACLELEDPLPRWSTHVAISRNKFLAHGALYGAA